MGYGVPIDENMAHIYYLKSNNLFSYIDIKKIHDMEPNDITVEHMHALENEKSLPKKFFIYQLSCTSNDENIINIAIENLKFLQAQNEPYAYLAKCMLGGYSLCGMPHFNIDKAIAIIYLEETSKYFGVVCSLLMDIYLSEHFARRAGLSKNLHKAIDYCLQGIKLSDGSCVTKLLNLWQDVAPNEKNYLLEKINSLAPLLEENAPLDPRVACLLGLCLEFGIGFEVNAYQAFSLYRQTIAKKNPLSYLLIGRAYEYGIGIEKNLFDALHFYKMANYDVLQHITEKGLLSDDAVPAYDLEEKINELQDLLNPINKLLKEEAAILPAALLNIVTEYAMDHEVLMDLRAKEITFAFNNITDGLLPTGDVITTINDYLDKNPLGHGQ